MRQLGDRAAEKGAQDISLDWWTGNVKSQGKRIATVRDGGSVEFVTANPFLDPVETMQWLEEQQRIFRASRDWQQ